MHQLSLDEPTILLTNRVTHRQLCRCHLPAPGAILLPHLRPNQGLDIDAQPALEPPIAVVAGFQIGRDERVEVSGPGREAQVPVDFRLRERCRERRVRAPGAVDMVVAHRGQQHRMGYRIQGVSHHGDVAEEDGILVRRLVVGPESREI